MSNPYSEATVELVTDAIAKATLAPAIGGTRRHARLVLDALCSAGLLLPEGADAGIDYAVRFVSPDGNHMVSADRQQQAHALASSHSRRPGCRAEVLRVRSWLVEEIEASYPARSDTRA